MERESLLLHVNAVLGATGKHRGRCKAWQRNPEIDAWQPDSASPFCFSIIIRKRMSIEQSQQVQDIWQVIPIVPSNIVTIRMILLGI